MAFTRMELESTTTTVNTINDDSNKKYVHEDHGRWCSYVIRNAMLTMRSYYIDIKTATNNKMMSTRFHRWQSKYDKNVYNNNASLNGSGHHPNNCNGSSPKGGTNTNGIMKSPINNSMTKTSYVTGVLLLVGTVAIGCALVIAIGSVWVLTIRHNMRQYELYKQQQSSKYVQYHKMKSFTQKLEAENLLPTTDAVDYKTNDVAEIPILIHEDRFHSTIKKCYPWEDGRKKCSEYVPKDRYSNELTQRVAIITPPGYMFGTVIKRIQQITDLQNDNNRQLRLQQQQHSFSSSKKKTDRKAAPHIDLILTSHVPPYGYSKTHGYTKVFRIIPRPILIQVIDALFSVLEPNESYKMITIDDVKSAFRQILRFHCRLSRVAAHTSLHSITQTNLALNPILETKRISKFLLYNYTNTDAKQFLHDSIVEDDFTFQEDDAGPVDVENDKTFIYINKIMHSIRRQFLKEKQHRRRARITPNTVVSNSNRNQYEDGDFYENRSNDHDIGSILDAVLMDEVQQSKNFTTFPCLSFWSVGNDPYNVNEIGILPKRLAKLFSPDCSASTNPYSKCFVERDICESNADPVCSIMATAPPEDKSNSSNNNNNNNSSNTTPPKIQEQK